MTPEFLLSAERHGNGGTVHRLPGKTMRQNTTTRGKLPQKDAPALLREPSAPGTAGRQRPKRKRNVMPRRKRQVWTAGRPESPCGTPWTAPGGRRSPAAAPAPAPAYSPLDSAPACPDAAQDAGMMTARHHGSVPESLIPAAPRSELLSSLKREAPLLRPSRALLSIPWEPHRVTQDAGPGLSLMQRLFCEISPGNL